MPEVPAPRAHARINSHFVVTLEQEHLKAKLKAKLNVGTASNQARS